MVMNFGRTKFVVVWGQRRLPLTSVSRGTLGLGNKVEVEIINAWAETIVVIVILLSYGCKFPGFVDIFRDVGVLRGTRGHYNRPSTIL